MPVAKFDTLVANSKTKGIQSRMITYKIELCIDHDRDRQVFYLYDVTNGDIDSLSKCEARRIYETRQL